MSIAALRDELANIKADDLPDALGDFFMLSMGVTPRNPHPGARLLQNTRATIGETVAAIADHGIANRSQVDMRFVQAQLTTGELGRALESAIEARLQSASSDLISDARWITRPIPLPDFRPANLPTADTGEFVADPEGAAVEQMSATFNGESIQVGRSSRNLVISREALLEGSQMELLSGLFDAVGQASGRAVSRAIANLLTANANLADGSAWFDAAFGNDLAAVGTETTPTLETLSRATGALMTQQTLSSLDNPAANYATGVKAATMIVSPSMLVESQTVISALSPAAEMRAIALPELPSTHWFLVGNQANAAIAMATLGGDPLSVSVINPRNAPNNIDGAAYRCRNEFGVGVLSRNIIRTAVA